MELILVKNLIWPVLASISVISFLNYILDGKRSNKILFIVFGILGLATAIYYMMTNIDFIYLQIYLFMFCLSISLVILALRKSIDAFTIIGIFLMVVMLILLLRFNLI